MGAKAQLLVTYIIAALPLLIYPFLLLANIMALGNADMVDKVDTKAVVAFSFLIASTAYPLVFGACAALSWRRYNSGESGKAVLFSRVLLLYLLVLAALVTLWSFLENP